VSKSDQRLGRASTGENKSDGEPPSLEPALGSDPFEALRETDPLDEWLDAAEQLVRGRAASGTVREPAASGAQIPVRELPPSRPVVGLRRGPSLSEVELPPPTGALERLLDEDARRRLEALTEALPADGSYDQFGLSARALRNAFPFLYALYRLYFRVRSHGHEHIPPEGAAVMVANHGGLLPFDGAMAAVDVFLHSDPPRLARAIVDLWAGTLPFVNVFFARVGQVIGTHENFKALLDEGQLVLMFPEGMDGIRKPIGQRYRLQRFHVGFIEHALRSRSPIVPVAVLGSDDQAPILYDVKPLARWLGLPVAPITPTFPWLGPLGLLPYPVNYRIVYGEPLALHERFEPEAAEDAALVRVLSSQVWRTVQNLLDENR
jgi:1-acyl-sn-glycerol-3-phosphate acyltransferase